VLPPPQFGLRTLLWLVTVCAVLFSVAGWLEPVAVAGLILLVLCVVAHVAGNAIGTRLRANGDQPIRGQSGPHTPRADGLAGWDSSYPSRTPLPCAPATSLGQRYNLGWPIVIATFAGLISGGIGGGLWALFTTRGPIEPTVVAVGVVAFGSLGSLGAFLICGFTQVLCSAAWQALRHSAANPAAAAREFVGEERG
jgi:hypothetical protein